MCSCLGNLQMCVCACEPRQYCAYVCTSDLSLPDPEEVETWLPVFVCHVGPVRGCFWQQSLGCVSVLCVCVCRGVSMCLQDSCSPLLLVEPTDRKVAAACLRLVRDPGSPGTGLGCWRQWPPLISLYNLCINLDWRPLYIKELVQAVVLCYAASSVAFSLCCAAQILWLQDKLSSSF